MWKATHKNALKSKEPKHKDNSPYTEFCIDYQKKASLFPQYKNNY